MSDKHRYGKIILVRGGREMRDGERIYAGLRFGGRAGSGGGVRVANGIKHSISSDHKH